MASPGSPKEALSQCASKEEDDETSFSAECDIDSETVSKEDVKEISDDIGNELDYEAEIIPALSPEHNSSDKTDESKSKDPTTGGGEDEKDDTQPVSDANKDKRELEEGEDEGEISEEEPTTGGGEDGKGDAQPASDANKDKEELEEGEDEGEISGEEDDLEEGELKDGAPFSETSQSQSTPRQICRYFNRGQCYFGVACRFLHLTNNDGKGQYNMFARHSDGYYGASINPMMPDRPGPHARIDFMSAIPPPPIQMEPSPVESAWERGLREAKELVKKAHKRKEEEPDFDKKKNYLSINFNDFNIEKSTEFEKENDYVKSPYDTKRNPDTYYRKENSRETESFYGDGARVGGARDNLRSGPRYENFEVHYTQTRDDDMSQRPNFDRRPRDRSRGRFNSSERERYASKERNRDRNNTKEDRTRFNVQMRARAFDYVDPWRRSKTPKARGGRSRSGSYSSVSSSYSDRSSRSGSGSYSRSSSRSSSRSPSIKRERESPDPDTEFSKTGSNKFSMLKKKTSTTRSPSFSSRSRSRSPPSSTRSVSRSRSYSRSISMDSVSSDSSVSHSSRDSPRNRNPSLPPKKPIVKLPLEKLDEHRKAVASGELSSYDVYPSEAPEDNPSPAFPSFQHLIPQEKAAAVHTKQPIKLTLLPKATTSKNTFPKREIDRTKLMLDVKNVTSNSDAPNYPSGRKRPLSPTLSAVHQKPDTLPSKKSTTSSRRDELLKQLKAVEDAIARKRTKFF